MNLPLIKKIIKICCTVTVFTITPACQQKCSKCDSSEISEVIQAKPETKTKRHLKTSFVNDDSDEDYEDLKIN